MRCTTEICIPRCLQFHQAGGGTALGKGIYLHFFKRTYFILKVKLIRWKYHKGASIYVVHIILGFFDPLPLSVCKFYIMFVRKSLDPPFLCRRHIWKRHYIKHHIVTRKPCPYKCQTGKATGSRPSSLKRQASGLKARCRGRAATVSPAEDDVSGFALSPLSLSLSLPPLTFPKRMFQRLRP